MEILQEVYFGKEALAPIQKQFSKVRDKLRDKHVTSTTNLDPEILKFNRMVEDFFGFSACALYIQPDHSINAHAYSVGTMLSDQDRANIRASLISNPTGFKYDPQKHGSKLTFIMAVNIGLLENDLITDDEILAIVLHEIGHGFFEAVMDKDGTYVAVNKIVSAIQYTMACAKACAKSGHKATKAIIEKELSVIAGFAQSIRHSVQRFINGGKAVARKFAPFTESMYDNMNKQRIEYTNEKFADTFAAMYGYGVDLHSALLKIYQYEFDAKYGATKRTFSNRIADIFSAYKMYAKEIIRYYFKDDLNEHPNDLARIKVSMEYLKKEMSKYTIDPKIKIQLLEQLNQLNKLIEDYKNYPKDRDSMRALRLYNIMLYKTFGGDPREMTTDNDALFDTIDNRYEESNN